MFPLKDNIPTEGLPVVTIALIVVNVLFFVWQLSFSGGDYSSGAFNQLGITERDENTLEYGAIPYRITHPGESCAAGVNRTQSGPAAEIFCEGTAGYETAEQDHPFAPIAAVLWLLTLFTSMFMHGGILHIAFNMLFLWVFGNNVEERMGRIWFLLFYLLAGVAALYSQAALNPDSTVPTIGASGAIAGVLGAYALLYPRARVLTVVFLVFFVTMIEIPAMVMLGIWFVLQALPAVGQLATPDVASSGGVAYFAHIGGFLFGLAVAGALALRDRATRAGPATA